MSIKDIHTTLDVLKSLRKLPTELIKELPILMVDRKGRTDDAYMRTENFIGHVSPMQVYQLTWNGFKKVNVAASSLPPLPKATEPTHATIGGTWDRTVDLFIEEANILGGNGNYFLGSDKDELVIPIAECTPENLAFYNCELIPVGGMVKFDTKENLPVTVVNIGEDYPNDFLLVPELGGGAYIEIHDRPHFHMPLEKEAGGHLIVGKKDKQGNELISAFKVPYGYGVHIAPWVIHADAYLKGRYLVIYSNTSEFSTVTLRQENGNLASINIKSTNIT